MRKTPPSNVGRAEAERRVRACQEGLRRAGVRLTHQRLAVFRELAGSDGHPDAETIHRRLRRRLPTLSLDTVYRTLWLLLDLGLIDTLGGADHQVRFDGNDRPHHHFVCRKCGTALDFVSAEFDRLEIPGAVKALGRVERTRVEVRGICQRCSREINAKSGAGRRKENQ